MRQRGFFLKFQHLEHLKSQNMYQLILTKILVHHHHRPFGLEWAYTDCVNPILQVVDLLKKKRDMTFNEVSFVIYLFSDRIFMFTSMATSKKGLCLQQMKSLLL